MTEQERPCPTSADVFKVIVQAITGLHGESLEQLARVLVTSSARVCHWRAARRPMPPERLRTYIAIIEKRYPHVVPLLDEWRRARLTELVSAAAEALGYPPSSIHIEILNTPLDLPSRWRAVR